MKLSIFYTFHICLYILNATDCIESATNFTRISEFTTLLYSSYNFESLVMYNSRLHLQDHPEFIQRLQLAFESRNKQLPIIFIETKAPPIVHLFKLQLLSIVFFDSINDPIFTTVAKSLHLVRSTKTILVYDDSRTNVPMDLRRMDQIFAWCWNVSLINVNLVYFAEQNRNEMEIFTYNPFPRMKFINLTEKYLTYMDDGEEEHAQQNVSTSIISLLFPNKLKNLNGYEIRALAMQDPPRYMKYKDSQNRTRYGGIGGFILTSFYQKYNAVFVEIELGNWTANLDVKLQTKLLKSGEIRDFSSHAYGMVLTTPFTGTYPIIITPWLLIVPVVSEIPKYMYLILPFDTDTWNLLVATVFFMTGGIFAYRIYQNNHPSYSRAFLDCFSLMLNLALPVKRILNYNINFLMIYTPIYLIGFMLTNLYLAKLTSFFNSIMLGPQYNTLEDLDRAKLRLLIVQYEADQVIHNNGFPSEYIRMMEIAEPDVVFEQRKQLNTSYFFLMTSERWNFFLKQQQFLKKKRFRVSDIYFGTYLIAFPIQFNSVFREVLDHHILQCYDNGFIQKLDDMVYQRAVWLKLINRFFVGPDDDFDSVVEAMTVTYFVLIWGFLLFGYATAFLCFVGENLMHHFCGKRIAKN